MRVGIVDLQYDSLDVSGLHAAYVHFIRKQYVSIMPQIVAAWCRRLGCRVHYTTYYGQADPVALLPADLDMLFVSAYTRASNLAYAISKLFRRRGVLTVIGGAHARAFPQDALRFFDIVVQNCDQRLIEDIVRRRIDYPAIVSASGGELELPPVAERLPEIIASVFIRGRPSRLSLVPVLASTGCPYACEFCVDWRNSYKVLPLDRLRADLLFLSEKLPEVLIGYADPNFGVRFDDVLGVIESVPKSRRNRYIVESSLSILKESRLRRLRDTNCVYIAPGIESWNDYSNKAGVPGVYGREKLEWVIAHLARIERHIPGVQANFVVGVDADDGAAPMELTKEFIRRVPDVFPSINLPTPFGGTPLFDRYRSEGRILEAMPFLFYQAPFVPFIPKAYDIRTYLEHLIDISQLVTSRLMTARRWFGSPPWQVKLIHTLRAWNTKKELREYRRMRRALDEDPALCAFHEGRSRKLPNCYEAAFVKRLGRYGELFNAAERTPLLPPISTAAAAPARATSGATLQ